MVNLSFRSKGERLSQANKEGRSLLKLEVLILKTEVKTQTIGRHIKRQNSKEKLESDETAPTYNSSVKITFRFIIEVR